jgi:hypothetical protein
MPPDPNKVEACKTYLEQIKLLVALSSAFLLAPAVFYDKLDLVNTYVYLMEGAFVLSVILGYATTGALAGTQEEGEFDIYRRAIQILSILQLFFFIIGIVFLFVSLRDQKKHSAADKKESPIIVNHYNTNCDATAHEEKKTQPTHPSHKNKPKPPHPCPCLTPATP